MTSNLESTVTHRDYSADEYRIQPWESRLYEKLGVRAFQRVYNATVGTLVKKVSGRDFVQTPTRRGLEEAIESTVNIEALHWVGGIIMGIDSVQYFANGEWSKAALATSLNILVNAYPIILQRYNRGRMLSINERMTGSSRRDYSSSAPSIHSS